MSLLSLILFICVITQIAYIACLISKTCDLPHSAEASNLRRLYQNKRPTYNGAPLDEHYRFNVELVEEMLAKMKRGKAAGLDGLTVEHLTHSHPNCC